jgi:hypothetical protein
MMSQEVIISAAGGVGSGKSALLGEIEILLKSLGVNYRWADPEAAQAEKNLTHADWIGELEATTPSVVLVERIAPGKQTVLKILEEGKAASASGKKPTDNPYLKDPDNLDYERAYYWMLAWAAG